MKSKKLGRSELLSWLNKTVESEYLKVEDLSDGVGFCQIIEAFYKGCSHELNTLKLNSINDNEQKQKNLSTFNIILGKAGCPRQIDPIKMSKGVFSLNLEFLQYLWDFLYKSFGTVVPKKKYNGLKRRLEILKSQGNKNFKNINKLLPPHLITNKLAFQINKNKDFFEVLNDNMNNLNNNNDAEEQDENNMKENNEEENDNINNNDELDQKLDKYNLFFKLLQEDLGKYINKNKSISNEIADAEEEKDYYLEKLQTIYDLCKEEQKKAKTDNKKKICEDIMNIISNIPDDFK
jgi:RP/EB family microtubule-associated protein